MTTLDKIKEIMVDSLNVEEDQITLEASLADDLEIDSLDSVEFIMAVEDEFEIEISDEKAAEMKTVKDIVDYVESQI